MLKTLLLLTILGTSLASAKDYSTNHKSGDSNSVTGFYFQLDQFKLGSDFTGSSLQGGTWNELLGDSTLSLNSITLKSSWNASKDSYVGAFSIFVYEGKITNATNLGEQKPLCISSNTCTAVSGNTGDNFQFNFTELSIDVSKTYTFLFSSTTDNFTLAKATEGVRLQTDNSSSDLVTDTNQTTGKIGDLDWKGTTNNSGQFVSIENMSLSTLAVPEPATTSLCLLGLVTFALRRRRN
ncbi:MAG: PEP-CTERM sorting domain-containing protein [Akkermansia sp.]